jgi:hypothetical protein
LNLIAQIARGSSVNNIREHEVLIRILGDFAINPRPYQVPKARRY